MLEKGFGEIEIILKQEKKESISDMQNKISVIIIFKYLTQSHEQLKWSGFFLE